MKNLKKGLGKVEAERFISLIIREPFDYSLWQQDLFCDISVKKLSRKAMEFVNNKKITKIPIFSILIYGAKFKFNYEAF